MDALSDFDFYQKGVCRHPVVASNHVTPFLEGNVSNLWVYYCCGQGYQVSNRFFSMPSARNRIIGTQFYTPAPTARRGSPSGYWSLPRPSMTSGPSGCWRA